MIRLIAFDLDGTLAELGQPIPPQAVRLLQEIERRGARVAICSGKPTYYLCGMMRQVGLRAPVLVGENGAVIQFGVDLPPRAYHVLPVSQAARASIRHLKSAMEALLPGMWFQPNEVGLTPFPRSKAEFSRIEALLEAARPHLQDVVVYRHCDSFDVAPAGIDKRAGLRELGRLLGISPEETAAVGDGVNDYPMFDYAGYSVGVRAADASRVSWNAESAQQALDHLLALLPQTPPEDGL